MEHQEIRVAFAINASAHLGRLRFWNGIGRSQLHFSLRNFSNKNHWVWNQLLDYEMQLLVLAALFYPQAIRVLFIGAFDFPNNEHILAPKNL